MLPKAENKDGEEKTADEEKAADGAVTPEEKKPDAEDDKNVEDATADKTVEKAPEAEPNENGQAAE